MQPLRRTGVPTVLIEIVQANPGGRLTGELPAERMKNIASVKLTVHNRCRCCRREVWCVNGVWMECGGRHTRPARPMGTLGKFREAWGGSAEGWSRVETGAKSGVGDGYCGALTEEAVSRGNPTRPETDIDKAYLILLAKVSSLPGRIRPILAEAEVRSSLGACLVFMLPIRVGNALTRLTPLELLSTGLAVACGEACR